MFAYYCPSRAEAKVRFSYLVYTAHVLRQCAQKDIVFDARVEMTERDDVSEEYLDSHVMPVSERVKRFKGPSRPKRRRRYKAKKTRWIWKGCANSFVC